MAANAFARLGQVFLSLAVAQLSANAQEAARLATVVTPTGAVEVRSEAVQVQLRDDDNRVVAVMHAYGYFAPATETRPITFLWNGGPGGSCALLHSGFAAPQIADLAEGAGVAANPLTLIDRSDLIYVDPIGTGFSRAVDDEDSSNYWGMTADAQAAAQFVAAVIAERGWQRRPIYLCGESYGGIRVAAMLLPLRQLGVAVAGLVMISPALETRTLWPLDYEDEQMHVHVDAMPTMAALAVANGKREVEDRRADIDAACQFAFGPLLAAVRNDDEVAWDDDLQLVEQVRQFTAGQLITRVMLRDRYDARQRLRRGYYCGVSTPILEQSVATVLRNAFGIASVADYQFMNRAATQAWHERRREPRSYPWDVRATEMIAAACRDGRGPRVFVAGGWYDLVVPFAVARRLRKQGAFGACEVIVKDYPGGHAIYVDPEAHRMLIRDLRSWLGCRSV